MLSVRNLGTLFCICIYSALQIASNVLAEMIDLHNLLHEPSTEHGFNLKDKYRGIALLCFPIVSR